MARPVTARMTMRAQIERDAGGANPWRGDAKPDWLPHGAPVRCFAWSRTKAETDDERTAATVHEVRCFFSLGADIDERDRVAWIRDRRGRTIFDGPLNVGPVERRWSHLEASLVRTGV